MAGIVTHVPAAAAANVVISLREMYSARGASGLQSNADIVLSSANCYIAPMVRFGTKTLLFAFFLVALWCSTFGGYSAGRDVRASVLLILFLAAGYAAIYSRGRSRAFWSGLFVVMLLAGGSFFQGPVNKYVPNFFWRTMQTNQAVTTRYVAPPAVYAAPTVSYAPVQPYSAVPSRPISPIAAPVAIPSVTINDYEFTLAVNDTIATVWTLVLGSLVGLVGMWVYGSTGRDWQDT